MSLVWLMVGLLFCVFLKKVHEKCCPRPSVLDTKMAVWAWFISLMVAKVGMVVFPLLIGIKIVMAFFGNDTS